MDFLPWSTFTRIVARYGGDARVRTLCCAEQYRAMAFAQLTYRESLRDIEVCLSAQASKLYHMGFREPVRRSTLADANETRDWRIYAEFAHRLIAQARKLYRFTSSLPSSRSASPWKPPSTLCSRFSRSPSSRKCRCPKHFPKPGPHSKKTQSAAN